MPTETVVWMDLVNANARRNTLIKSGGTQGAWDSGAISTHAILSGSGYVQASVDVTTTYRIVGLSSHHTKPGLVDIQYGAMLAGDTLKIYEMGLYKGSFGTLHAGDIVRVVVENGLVDYYLNNTQVYISPAPVVYPLFADSAISTRRSTVANALLAGTILGPVPTVTPAIK